MTARGREPTFVDLDHAHLLAVSLGPDGIVLEWYGPPRAALDPDAARELGYLLRSYANLAEPGDEPGGTPRPRSPAGATHAVHAVTPTSNRYPGTHWPVHGLPNSPKCPRQHAKMSAMTSETPQPDKADLAQLAAVRNVTDILNTIDLAHVTDPADRAVLERALRGDPVPLVATIDALVRWFPETLLDAILRRDDNA